MLDWLVEVGHRFLTWLERKIPFLFRFLYLLGLALSPAVALADEERRRERSMLYGTVALIPLVWLFSLGLNGLFSGLEGQFYPDADNRTVNFLEDRSNLILYAVICPLYISLCLQIIMVSSRYGIGVRDSNRPATRLEAARSAIAISLCFAAAASLIARYISDVAVGPHGSIYWFNNLVGDVRVLNLAGIYYCLMTFCFLSITLFALLNYLSISLASLRLANSVTVDDCSDIPAMRDAFYRFSQAYIYARWLIAVLMVHTLIWSRSELANTINIHLAGGLLLLAAFFLTAIPARHLDQKVKAAADACGKTLDEIGIVPTGAKAWLPWADRTIGACYALLWGWEPISDALTWLVGSRPQI